MLTLFLLIGTAFIVTSKQYQQTNKIGARLTETSNSSIDQQDLLNEVLNQLLRDTNNPLSSLRYHSLLRDMYGNDGVRIGPGVSGQSGEAVSFVTRWPDTFNGLELVSRSGNLFTVAGLDQSMNSIGEQFFWVATRFRLPDPTNLNQSQRAPLNLNENYYTGRVITFTEGELQGISARIVRYNVLTQRNPPSGDANLRFGLFMLMPLNENEIIRSQDLTAAVPSLLADRWPTTRAVINGMPFNGTGAGYDPYAQAARLSMLERVDLVDSNRRRAVEAPIALMPNATFFDFLPAGNLPPSVDTRYFGLFGVTDPDDRAFDGLGSSDESYDAADFQNMAMSIVQANAIETVLPDLTAANPQTLGNMVLPSFHRPALLNYWWAHPTFTGSNPLLYEQSSVGFLRKVMMRPNWWDHPEFTGSNPDFANATTPLDRMRRMIYGPWDVDNDLDGVRDSVWIDAGLPVMENSDGRLVKPLVSLLVVDMDGRLNLNAHGSEDIANQVGNQPLSVALADGASTLQLPNGTGYGPAEISLDPLMPGNDLKEKWDWYRRVFRGVTVSDMRVANDAFPTAILRDREFVRSRIGKFGGNDVVPGRPDLDILTQIEMQDVPAGTAGRAHTPNAQGVFPLAGYGTLPDFRGRYTLGLNDLGQPITDAYRWNPVGGNFQYDNQTVAADNPYELDLSLGAARGETQLAPDGPYTVAELERILRPYDADASTLPSRIWEFAGEFKDSTSHTIANLQRLNLWRMTVTTDSYDLPGPTVVLPAWMYVGPDGEPGIAARDDGAATGNDDPGEIGWFESDDFQAVMNPMRFTGRSRFPATQLTFADLLEYRIRVSDKNGDGRVETSEIWYKYDDPANPVRVADIDRAIRILLPREIAEGLKLDVNRPLGNGRDDNNNGVVDEPGELDATGTAATGGLGREPSLWATDRNNPLPQAFRSDQTGRYRDTFDRNGNGTIDSDYERGEGDVNNDGNVDLEDVVFVHNMRRQDLARDLYVMAMTLADPLPITSTNPTNAERDRQRARARRLAQWAINCVDFRDPDNIMTAFEYDENPFDGWSVDGYLKSGNNNSNDDIAGPDNNVGTDDDIGGIVWGAEAQELLMTETLAWHDRRTTDEDRPIEESQVGNRDNAFQVVPEEAGTVYGDPDNPDIDFDQKYRPRGVCFVELYCPLAPNPAASADTHRFDNAGNDLGIDITAVDEVTGDCPVWRMSVYQRPAGLDSRECANWDPDWVHDDFRPSTQPDGGGTEVRPDRSIYFAHIDTTNPARLEAFKDMDASDGVEFFTDADMQLPIATVRPGRYMVVGSGEEQNGSGRKERGSRVFGANIGDSENTARQRRIELRPNDNPLSNAAGGNDPIRLIEPANNAGNSVNENAYVVGGDPICDVAVITSALSGRGATDPVTRTQPNLAIKPMDRWFSITEPAGGYPGDDPNVRPTGASFYDGFPDKEGRYGNVAQAAAYDRPFDDVRVPQNPALAQPHQDGETRLRLGNLSNFQENDQLVIECYSMIYLQRLANPLLPYDKDTNPYRTVDGMSANVSLFNGSIENRKLDGLVNYGEGFLESLDTPEQRIEYRSSNAERHLASVQRGFTRSSLAGADASADLMSFELPNMPPGSRDNDFVAVRANRHPPANTQHVVNAVMDHTLGSVNYQMRQLPEPAGFDGLTPEEPFSWLTWNNRPFANSNELMLVPRSSASQMLREFSGVANGVEEQNYNPYTDVSQPQRAGGVPGRTDRPDYLVLKEQGEFGHLPNMQIAEPRDQANDIDKGEEAPAGFHRVLDYVHVSTPFVASETWLNPAGFGNVTNTTPLLSVDDPRYEHTPPFNRISSHREPGRININTVASAHVWDGGVMHREIRRADLPWSLGNNYQFSWLRDVNSMPGPTNPRIYGHVGPLYVDPSNDSQGEPVNGVLESRRGYAGYNHAAGTIDFDKDNSLLALEPSVPTFFANPFRSSDAGNLVPLNSLQRPGSDCSMMRRRTIHAGLDGEWGVRGTNDNPRSGQTATPIADDLEEFMATASDDREVKIPLFGSSSDLEFNDGARHAAFGFQPMTRLSSMTTQRSNVYAVWVTIGFFEVQEAPSRADFLRLNDPEDLLTVQQQTALYDRVYPEGYQFGKEAGADTGNIVRVREFAMIDRSIPVAFEPGRNHNVEKAIRLRRRLD